MDLTEGIKLLPKVEHHVHLLGAIQPATLMRIIVESGEDTSYQSVNDIAAAFEFQDFTHFLSVYKETIDLINEEKYFEDMAFELLQKCHEANVKYVEMSFSAPDHIKVGLDFDLMLEAIRRGIRRGYSKFGVASDIRIDLVRDYGPEFAMETLDRIENNPERIVSIDIGGFEQMYPPEPFAEVYQRAREMGLHTVAHAGEAAGTSSIWGVVNQLGAERIGHAVTAIQDESLMVHLKRKDITIETCPTSNVRTRVVSSLEEHPIRAFFDRGLSLTVNSDDPTFFGTDMNHEYLQLHEVLGFSLEELMSISLNALRVSFIDSEEKLKLREVFESEYEHIRRKLV